MILQAAEPASIDRAAQVLAEGGLVAIPTETVYGLAADATNDAAVARIFETKGRPADHPLIVHVADRAGADAFTGAWPPFAEQLAKAFWPGPLTLILPRRTEVARAAAAGLPTVGLRCPQHPAAQALLVACANRGVPGLAAPSANRFGRISPTSAAHVVAEFADRLLLVLDGGNCEVGIESTIVDCTRGAPVLLRPGVLGAERLEAAAGQRLQRREEPQGVDEPRAPGMLAAHYAPQATLRLMNARALQTALDVLGPELDGTGAHIAVYARSALKCRSASVLLRPMPQNSTAAARQLFAVLRDCDDAGVRLIWVETPPDSPDWDGVRDRLLRASAAG
ncbi:MAG: L-threonylcarbamoyladenylate synthase [Burkholderiales bacterium]